MKQQLNFKTYGALSTKALDTAPVGEGVIQIEGYASKSYDKGKPVVDYDNEWVDISGFDLTTCTSLLFNHKGNEIKIGKCRLEHRPDGAYLYGEVHEKLNDKVYYAVKHGIMTDFSIGFSATDYEYKTIDGQDVLTFTKGFVWETSVCNIVAANPKSKIETTKALRQDKKALELAKWLGDEINEFTLDKYTEVKSIIENGKCVGFSCEIEQLKKANPTQDCSCNTKEEGNVEKKKDIKQVIKALTFEETENSNWNQLQKLDYYFEILEDTIEDNFYETMWYEGITPEEAKANILGAIQAFVAKLDEFKLLDSGASGEPVPTEDSEDEVITKQKRDEAMHIKSNEGADVVTADATGDKILEGEELEVNPEQEVVNVPEQTSDNNDSTEPSEVAEKVVEEIVTEEVPTEEVPEKLNVEYLSTVDLNGLSAEEVEELYNEASELVDNLMSDDKVILLASASDILDKIEALVAEDIQ